ncbi:MULTISPECIES: acyl carrier protein [unclassified Microbacterium]|uniref:acyl carrier protein n=1 Tax=unclassified Microbacterium TaxID=2609290 RepID=UPI0015E3F6B3|nr:MULTISPECIES: phosphopantetheine-binding protein [unclassified Microbacterium]
MSIDQQDFITRIRGFVADLRGVDESHLEVGLDSDLRNDLDVDSLSSVELALQLDEWYSVELEDADVFEAATVGDLHAVVQSAASTND